MKVLENKFGRTGRTIATAITLAFLALVFLTAGATNTAFARPGEKLTKYEVTIDNFSFGPADLTVPAGSTVTWVNHDDIPHTVVSTEKKFASQALDTGDKFSFEFKTAGTYEYFCSLHPRMTAKVVVQ